MGATFVDTKPKVQKLRLLQKRQEKVIQLEHSPYSPDLSPCNIFLFLLLKKMLASKCYASRSALGSAIFQGLNTCIPRGDYFAAFKLWIARLQKCISVQGEYFEGMMLKVS